MGMRFAVAPTGSATGKGPGPRWAALSACLVVVASSGVPAAADWRAEREALERVHVVDRFRIFYSLSGPNALKTENQLDGDGNRVPDFIETVAAKLRFADALYRQGFGFNDPLDSARFRGKVHYVDVHFVDLRGQGNSGDGVHRLRYRTVSGEPLGSLIVTLNAGLDAGSVTPEHELFHTYQYGYTSIKNGWLSEGTARWVDDAFRLGVGSAATLPQTQSALEDALERSYEAKDLWRRLAQLCDTNGGRFRVPEGFDDASLRRLYPGMDYSIHGYAFIRGVYGELSRMEHGIAAQRGYAAHDWRSRQKTSPLNDRQILAALLHSIDDLGCPHGEELARFTVLARAYLQTLGRPQSPDLTSRLAVLGNPFQSRYPDADAIYARNIWDMHRHAGSLFLGAGNAANAGPIPNAGPVPIIRYDPRALDFVTEGEVQDEQIHLYREIDGRLFIPGVDARGSSRLGNFYRRDGEGRWRMTRNIPQALHNFDMARHHGRLFAALGTPKGAAVAISADEGRTWRLDYLGAGQRVYNLLLVDGGLYAVKQMLAKGKIKSLPAAEQANYFSLAEYRGGRFQPRPDLKPASLFPATSLQYEKTMMLNRTLPWGTRVVYIGAYYHSRPIGVYVAASLREGASDVQRVGLPKAYVPTDLLVRDDQLFILCTQPTETGYRSIVLRVDGTEPRSARELFHFDTPTVVRSFEEHNGDYYFGLGYQLQSQSRWRSEELPSATGQILRISGQDITSAPAEETTGSLGERLGASAGPTHQRKGKL